METEVTVTDMFEEHIIPWRKWSAGTTLAAISESNETNVIETIEIEVNYYILLPVKH